MQCFALIPAAGRSQRMGRPKLLLPWGNATLIEHVVTTWRASRVDHVITIHHPEDEDLANLCAKSGAFTVAPDSPPAEMKDSIRCGLKTAQQMFGAGGQDAW